MLERKQMVDKSKIYMQHGSRLVHDEQHSMAVVYCMTSNAA
jgi:hypothetical protein